MIATLRGPVTAIGTDHVVVEVGGIGFRVYVPTPFLEGLKGPGEEVSLFTYLHLRENEVALYGCPSEEEMTLFELLLRVSGVGPRLALAILSALPPQSLRTAIAQENPEILTTVPGIGPKMARNIVFHLKDKLKALYPEAVPALSEADAEVIAALTALGYSLAEAQRALRSLPKEVTDVEERIKLALAYFAR